MAQLETLGRLCEMLSISSEEQLSVLPVDQLVPVLVSCEGWSRVIQLSYQYQLTGSALQSIADSQHGGVYRPMPAPLGLGRGPGAHVDYKGLGLQS